MIGLPIDPALAWKSVPAMLEGLGITLALTLIVMVLGVLLAVPLTAMRMSPHRLLNWPAQAFVVFFRGAPVLILLYLVYYGFGQVEALRESPLWLLLGSAFGCAVIGLTLNHAAYLVEIARGSLLAVPTGLIEAGNSLGLSPRETLVWIRLPLALRYGLKAYQNEVIMFTKGTAVVSVITVTDLTAQAQGIFEVTYDPLTPMLTAAVLYWLLINAMRLAFGALEHHLTRHLRAAPSLADAGPATATSLDARRQAASVRPRADTAVAVRVRRPERDGGR